MGAELSSSFDGNSTISTAPTYLPEVTEDLLTGGRLLRRAFLAMPYQSAPRDQPLFREDGAAPLVMIHRGLAYRSCTLPNGRRAILDLLLPGDVGGLEHLVLRRRDEEIIAGGSVVGYRAITPTALRRLMAETAIALTVTGLLAEARRRLDRQLAMVARMHARERLIGMLLDIHDRLRRRELIARPTFNLPLTQEQIADYLGLTMVHVNRTLRQLREERLALIDRQVVIILDLPALREIVQGLPSLVGEPATSDAPLGLIWDGRGDARAASRFALEPKQRAAPPPHPVADGSRDDA